MGVIYMFTGPNGKKYIGQHNRENADKRINEHIMTYHRMIAKISRIKVIEKRNSRKRYHDFDTVDDYDVYNDNTDITADYDDVNVDDITDVDNDDTDINVDYDDNNDTITEVCYDIVDKENYNIDSDTETDDDPDNIKELKLLKKQVKDHYVMLYHAFEKHGVENFEWEILHSNVKCEDLNRLEDECILSYKTLVPDGYNMRLNDGNPIGKNYAYGTRVSNYDAIARGQVKNNDTYRKYKDETKGLPTYVTYYQDKDDYRGYKVEFHPLCRTKSFTSKHIELDVLKANCLAFLESLNGKKYEKPERKLPPNVIKPHTDKDKLGFTAYFGHQKKKHYRYFGKDEDDEVNLQNAIDWLEPARARVKAGLSADP
jgi:hypothetical protein